MKHGNWLGLEFWKGLMGRDLPQAEWQPLQASRTDDGHVHLRAGHVRWRFEPGTRVGLCVEDGRTVLREAEHGVEVRDDWGGWYNLPLPAHVESRLADATALAVGRGKHLELAGLSIEEHGPDVLGPRLIDELRRDGARPPSVVRHVVKGYALADWTPERLRELEETVCAGPLARDPLPALAEGSDWVAWQSRRSLTRAPAPGDVGLGHALAAHALEGQLEDGSWDESPVRTAYAVLRALAAGVPPDDVRLRAACRWLLDRPEPDGRPGLWMQTEEYRREWNAMREGSLARPREGMYFHMDEFTDADYDLYRLEEPNQVIPTCCRNFHPVCYSRMLEPSASVAAALCLCGHSDHPRVRNYANTMLQVGGEFGYFCSCHGIVSYDKQVEDRHGVGPDFGCRTEDLAIALRSMPYGYGRDAQDLLPLAQDPNIWSQGRPKLADTNGWVPYSWHETGIDDCYALVGAYWQNADCWAKTNRALAQFPGWPGSITAFLGLFQCHLYQTPLGAWDQGYPAGILRMVAEMTHRARQTGGEGRFPEIPLARVMVLKTVPWLREHQGEDGLWHEDVLPVANRGALNRPPSPRLATYHIASVLNDFGLLDRLRPT